MVNWLRKQELKEIVAPLKTIASQATKYLKIDGGKVGANILSIVIKGLVGAEWSIKLYVPAEYGVTTPNAGDVRLTEKYISTDIEGGLLNPFAFNYNCFIEFTNDSDSSDNIDAITIIYKADEKVILTWEV